jgi:hypothetical protein
MLQNERRIIQSSVNTGEDRSLPPLSNFHLFFLTNIIAFPRQRHLEHEAGLTSVDIDACFNYGRLLERECWC